MQNQKEKNINDITNEVHLCKRCHRRLKDSKSIELGFGKTCYKKQVRNKSLFLFKIT